jgi:hypothetical protein
VWLIALLIPVYLSRWIVSRRLWAETPFTEFLIGFIALCAINIVTAPYETRGVILLFRPLLGIALVFYLVEYAKRHQHLKLPLLVTTAAGLLLGVIALTATEWSEGKTAFSAITTRLPSYWYYPGVEGLFNPNELAGAITWLAPLTLGIALYYRSRQQMRHAVLAAVGAGLMLAALVFGQSLSGLLGIAAGLIILLAPRRFKLLAAGVIIGMVMVAQLLIASAPSTAVQLAAAFSGREDLNSLQHREVIWMSARQAVIDHPFTGIGMAMYRNPVVWEAYPTPGYDRYQAPHAHNEILHIATDLGIPGAFLLLCWYGLAGFSLIQAWRNSPDESVRLLVTGIGAGLIAHLVYGLTDAVPLWDRFAFLFYWLLGFAAAQPILLAERQSQAADSDQRESAMYSQSEARA